MLHATMMDIPLTLDLLLERAGTVFKDVEIVSRKPDRSLHRCTNSEMYVRAKRLARALVAAGIKPGDRVATLMWNHYAHLECYFGIPASGAVLHTLNLRLHADEIGYIADHAQDRFLIVDDILLPLFEQFKDKARFERVIVFNYGGDAHPHEDYEQFLASAPDVVELPRIREEWAAGMCYTSGTTGRPKGVLYGHKTSVLHAMGSSLPDACNLSVRDCVVPVVPMFHAMAWGMPYSATMVGARQALPGPHLDAESLLDLFAETGTTFTAGVPTIWMRILEELDRHPGRWKLRPGMRMIVGGSATPPSMVRAFEKHDLQIIAAWGMTETSPICSIAQVRPEIDARGDEARHWHRAQAGLPVPLVDVRVIGDAGPQPWDGASTGELQVRGPWITGSYYLRPDAAGSFTEDGWMRTGDVATMTPDGYIHITDRTKDLIKSGGEWISSVELENELMAHAAVAEAAVIAVPHEKWMERPLACVVLKPGARATPEELSAHLAKKFAKWWLPEAYAFIDEVPKTSTGKFQKLKLRERFSHWDWNADTPAAGSQR
ncbi:MAG: long-chain fatty acid--CoA ligase [Sinimarinibacterium sp.]|jgi:fatty-acyl-CoA synthase